MRICILAASYEFSTSALRDVDLERDVQPHLAPEHVVARVDLRKRDLTHRLLEEARSGHDVFVNLCDGAADEDRAGIEVVETLESLGQAYTGASPAFYDPSREAMKRACFDVGVSTPAFARLANVDELDGAASRLRFPCIVKHPSGYSSVGMTRASRVTDRDALRREVERTIAAYGAALVEEFVEGREYTVLVVEDPDRPDHPHVYPPVEFVFPPGETFKHFELKWVDHGSGGWRSVDDAELASRLEAATRRVFLALGGDGYARADFRVDARGEPMFLEINPNCGVFYAPETPGSADVILARSAEGHRGFVERLLRGALARRNRTGRARRG